MFLTKAEELKKLGEAVCKLMKVLGKPDWFSGVETAIKDDKVELVIILNRMLSPEQIKYCIPRDVDTFPIKIIYRRPRFYGKDGPTVRG